MHGTKYYVVFEFSSYPRGNILTSIILAFHFYVASVGTSYYLLFVHVNILTSSAHDNNRRLQFTLNLQDSNMRKMGMDIILFILLNIQ